MTTRRARALSFITIARAWLTVAVATALLLGVRLHGQDLVYERFGEYLESLRDQSKIPGLAAAIIGPSDIVWERAFGRQDLDQNVFTRTDTPFHLDGITQLFTAGMTLRCVEEARLSLEDRAGQFRPDSPDANATVGQLLTHSIETPGGLIFAYRPERLDPLWPAVRFCEGGSFRKTLRELFNYLGMVDSVPGPDAAALVPPAEGIPPPDLADRYRRVLARLATPYYTNSQGRTTKSQYNATTLTPAGGAISTVRDFARFDVSLRRGEIVRLTTLVQAWQPPVGANKQRLPHGFGWFVQAYNTVPVVWQFGVGDLGSSSLVVTLPAQQLTLVLLANSNGLVKPYPLAAGDLRVSPFGKLFMETFAH
jgi:CubicO group peptidase (beta-lactamase class C family)